MKLLLLFFLAVIAVNWPELPYNARLADLIFIPLAVAVLMQPTAKWRWRAVDWAVAGYLVGVVPPIAFSAGWQHSAVVGLDDDDIGFADIDEYQPRRVANA